MASFDERLTFNDKRNKMIDVLNNHFGVYNELPEISSVTDEEFKEIITLYEEEASKDGRGPWNYTHFNDLIIMQKCVYEVVKNNSSYYSLMVKLEGLYEDELNRRLKRVNISWGDTEYQATYSEMPEYSMVLADMCCRQMEEFQEKYAKSGDVSFPEHSLETYKAIKIDLEKAGISMSDTNESIALGTEELINVEKAYDVAKEEKEKLAKEIETIELEQGILKIRIEILEMDKRIKRIRMETLGTYFDEWFSKRYPDEYKSYLEQEEVLKEHNNNQIQLDDLKARFDAATSELQMFHIALSTYERKQQRYNQMIEEDKKAFADEKEQARIYNLIFSEENERLRQSGSIYSAWDLGDKKIPYRYQGKTYEEVEAMLLQEREEKRLSDEAHSRREDLIVRACRKVCGVDDNYRLTDVQINNLRKQFDLYTDEELQRFLSGEELGAKPNISVIVDRTKPMDYSGKLEKMNLIDDILRLIYPDSNFDVYSTLAAKQLQSSSVEELRVIKEEWQKANLTSKSGRGM